MQWVFYVQLKYQIRILRNHNLFTIQLFNCNGKDSVSNKNLNGD